MDDSTRRSVAGIFGSVVVGALVALAASDGGARVGGVPVFAICAACAFVVNWLVFIPSNAAKTEKYYDLTGSLTYVTVVVLAMVLSGDLDARAVIVAVMVVVWAVRLGTFLFLRIRRAGRDGRFDEIKASTLRFLSAWTIQGLWVLLTAAAALAIISTIERQALEWVAYVGIAVWVFGFTIEVAADREKSLFKRDASNEGRFISTGLWAWSRHPNYFGEIVLWTGVTIVAIPVLSGWQWVVLVSPVFVTLLLTRVSGIPTLEARADERWGDEPDYQRYKDSTPVLVPRRPR